MDRSDAERVIRSLEVFATTGHGDVKALKGALKGRYRLRVGKWRALVRLTDFAGRGCFPAAAEICRLWNPTTRSRTATAATPRARCWPSPAGTGNCAPFATGAIQLTLTGPGEIVGENPFGAGWRVPPSLSAAPPPGRQHSGFRRTRRPGPARRSDSETGGRRGRGRPWCPCLRVERPTRNPVW